NKKDLDDVKKLVEDNCFINCAIVIAALGDVNNPTELIKKYLVKRPLADMSNIPVGFEGFVYELVNGLEEAKAQLTEKKKDLKQAEREKVDQQAKIARLTDENAQLRAQNQDLKNKKFSGAGAPGGKQNNYALTFFILCGICAVGTCLTIVDYPEVSAGLAAVALGLFLVGYFLYKGDEKDIGPVSTTDSPQVTRIFISSPDSAESFYTY
ncbi:MAG: bZIP transcription factor, partial [Wolbachia endosymbiont of Alcedoecus sp.]|nr:bZIP transcription factor [Wolbachia endosymbiont of Alcedoecus sp.]